MVIGYTGSGDAKQEVYITDVWCSLVYIARYYVFADDGSPCGKLVEE